MLPYEGIFLLEMLDDSCHIFSLSCKISLSIYQKIIIMIKKLVSSYDIYWTI